MGVIYIAGSMRNPKIPLIANELEARTDHEAFAAWHAVGPDADTFWRDYEMTRRPGITMKEAVGGYLAQHTFTFDKFHIDRSDALVMVLPCGRSAHIEAGYSVGQGKPTFALFEGEPDRFDIMYNFFTGLALNTDELVEMLRRHT